MSAEVRPEIAAHWSTAQFYRGVIAHLDGVAPTVNEMHDAAPLRGIPVVVLTPGGAEPIPDEDMRKLGDQTEQIIATHSEHWVHLDEPQLVIETILTMISRSQSRFATAGVELPSILN